MSRCGTSVGAAAFALAAIAGVIPAAIAGAQAVRATAREDGFYVIADSGPAVRAVSGRDIHLGKRFDEPGVRLSWLGSDSNDNERFSMSLEKAGAFPLRSSSIAFCVAGYCTTFNDGSRTAKNPFGPDTTTFNYIDAQFSSRPAAEAFARFFGAALALRAHPGYLLRTRFVLSKDSYSPDEAVPVRFEIQNVGTTAVTFWRDNCEVPPQFSFTAYGPAAYGRVVRDIGMCLGMSGPGLPLQPGETFTQDIDLRKWLTFTTPGTYRIIGSYHLSFYGPTNVAEPGLSFFPIWEDYATAEFELHIK